MLFWIIGGAVLFSHFIEGVSGFGCMILAMPVVSAIVGIKTAVPMLVMLSTVFDLALVWQDRKQIKWREAAKMTVITSLTMPFGLLVLKFFPEDILGLLLGTFMVSIAAFELHAVWHQNGGERNRKGKCNKFYVLLLAGVVQGAFGGSGPFMILYSRDVLRDKTSFRGTMAVVWVALNLINLVQYYMSGMVGTRIFLKAASMLPFLIVGYIAGTWIHKKINQRQFDLLVYAVLLISGVVMIG